MDCWVFGNLLRPSAFSSSIRCVSQENNGTFISPFTNHLLDIIAIGNWRRKRCRGWGEKNPLDNDFSILQCLGFLHMLVQC